MERSVAHEQFTYLLPVYRNKISCLEICKKQGKVRENDHEKKMATLDEITLVEKFGYPEFHS